MAVGPVVACAVGPDGTWLATTSRDHTARIWDVTTGTLRHTLTGHTDYVVACTAAPDGSRLATASHDRTVRIWDVATGKPQTAIRVEARIRDCAWLPDGTAIGLAGDAGAYLFAYPHQRAKPRT
jgi:WD40 repeat protein